MPLLCLAAIAQVFGADCDLSYRLTAAEKKQEVVLPVGCELRATTQEGTLIIRAGKDYVRFFGWIGEVRAATMLPRASPWKGNLGIYNPGASGMWRKLDGISRVVYQEYRQNFPTKEDAERFLSKYYAGESAHYDSDNDIHPAGVWNDSGVLVWWKRSRWAEALDVTVLQIVIAGEIPRALKGSQNANLVVHP